MKITYITSASFVDFDFPLIRSFKIMGHEIQLFVGITPPQRKSTLFNILEFYPHEGVFDSSIYENAIDQFKEYLGLNKIYIINQLHSGPRLKQFRTAKQISNYVKGFSPDIIHYISWPTISRIPFLLSRKYQVVNTIHDPVPHPDSSRKYTKIFDAINRLYCRFQKNFILLNQSMTKDFISYYKINNPNIHYSTLGNCEIMTLFGEDSPSTHPYILFYGRITKYKGVEVLLDSFTKIKNKFPEFKLIIAGSGCLYFDVSKYSSDSQIEIRNRYISLDELGSLIRNSIFVVCPYTSATQSGVVATVHAFNKSIIVTDVGGLPEMVTNNKTGLVVPPSDSHELAKAMEILLENSALREQIEANIAEINLNSDKSWISISNRYVNIYNSII